MRNSPWTSLRLSILGGLAAGALAGSPRPALAQELAPPTAAASAPAPSAAPATTFGAAGSWVLSVQSHAPGNSTSSFFLQKVSGGDLNVTIQPALDYFIGNGVSVGGVVGFSHGGSTTTVDLGARAGFNQGLTDKLTFWPTGGIYASYQSGMGNSSTTAQLVIYAPFLYHPVAHFFLGAGPYLDYQVHPTGYSEYGLDFVIGGWL
jgi:hypothetical protein